MLQCEVLSLHSGGYRGRPVRRSARHEILGRRDNSPALFVGCCSSSQTINDLFASWLRVPLYEELIDGRMRASSRLLGLKYSSQSVYAMAQ